MVAQLRPRSQLLSTVAKTQRKLGQSWVDSRPMLASIDQCLSNFGRTRAKFGPNLAEIHSPAVEIGPMLVNPRQLLDECGRTLYNMGRHQARCGVRDLAAEIHVKSV